MATHRWQRCSLVLALVLAARAGSAGPPFLTDDPEPIEHRHWEAYLFGTVDRASASTSTEGPAVELNFGAAPELHLHVVVPLATFSAPGTGRTAGLGDVELGAKYRFLDETNGRPQVGVFPMVEVPTGDAHRGLGNGRLWAKLPLWVQKSWGPWTTYGGGGYALNDAPGARSYPFGGWLVQRDLSKRLTLGGEVFAQGADTAGGRGSTFLNAGGILAVHGGTSLLFSAGGTVAGERHRVAYLGLYWTGGPRSPAVTRGTASAR